MSTNKSLAEFATEVRRLAPTGEPPLYPAYKLLFEELVYENQNVDVDILRRAPNAGFPDLTVSNEERMLNWIEVKHPSVEIDPLPPADATRFKRYKQNLPHIVLTNGWKWIIYKQGEETNRLEVNRNWFEKPGQLGDKEERGLIAFFNDIATLPPVHAFS